MNKLDYKTYLKLKSYLRFNKKNNTLVIGSIKSKRSKYLK